VACPSAKGLKDLKVLRLKVFKKDDTKFSHATIWQLKNNSLPLPP
jgi:hypothetical protein